MDGFNGHETKVNISLCPGKAQASIKGRNEDGIVDTFSLNEGCIDSDMCQVPEEMTKIDTQGRMTQVPGLVGVARYLAINAG